MNALQNNMKTLTMTTVRKFKNEQEYEDYKATVKEFIRIDWRALEDEGMIEFDDHKPGEIVVTRFELSV